METWAWILTRHLKTHQGLGIELKGQNACCTSMRTEPLIVHRESWAQHCVSVTHHWETHQAVNQSRETAELHALLESLPKIQLGEQLSKTLDLVL